MRRFLAVALAYFALTVAYSWPLALQLTSAIASDPYDPALNATVLWWNAVRVPFSSGWWNGLHFFPSDAVAALTENLVGLSPIASPVYWTTGNPLTTYNVAFVLSWPLSAIAAYLLAQHLTGRRDAAFVAGLAYGFAPYRIAEVGHIQMLSSYWMPIALLGLHRYLERRELRWLVLFGTAWLLQSLANGYFMLFGAVLVGLWIVWFGSCRTTWRAIPAVVLAWILASLPLVPVMLKYRTVHEHYGLRRGLFEALYFSATPLSWLETPDRVLTWGAVLRDGKDDLFPGATVVLLVLIALAAMTVRTVRGVLTRRSSPVTGSTSPMAERPATAATVARLRRARFLLWLIVGVSLAAIISRLALGPWDVQVLGVRVRMSDLNRARSALGLAILALLWMQPRVRALITSSRDAFAFYTLATIAMALLACGPVLRVADHQLLSSAPYAWLLDLPGFDELRVPTRFWMLGTLCLSVAAGLAFSRLRLPTAASRVAALALAFAGILVDGWLTAMPVSPAPQPWPGVEPPGRPEPVLELPLGPDYDAAATYRSIFHRRRVVNGVSGYDPPSYAPLQAGLKDREPGVLTALASLASYDVVVDQATDPDGAWARYAENVSGATIVAQDAGKTAIRVPQCDCAEPTLGAPLPIADVRAFRHDPRVAWDGRLETEWGDHPQRPDQWIEVDLGAVRTVGGVTQALGEYARDFPRHLAIDLSVDGASWTRAWDGSAAAAAFLAAVRAPREAAMRFSFAPHEARYVRLRQLAEHPNLWRVAELTVHGPR